MLILGFMAISLSNIAVSIVVRPLTYNCSQPDTNKIKFDVYVKNVGADVLGYRAHTLRFTMNRSILPASPLATGTVVFVSGTGDSRLAPLQATYNPASSFTITSTTLQVNLGSSATPFRDSSLAPRVNPGDSIWLGTFIVTSSKRWNDNTNSNPAWLEGTPVSVTVYDNPPSTGTATVCNSLGSGTSIASGRLENGIISANNPTGAGQLPCDLVLNSSGIPVVDDHNACTNDVYNSVTGIVTHTPIPGIDDGIPCTIDVCDPLTGITTHTCHGHQMVLLPN